MTQTKNNVGESEEDFGFTFSSEEEIQSKKEDKAEGLKKMIMPLLNNLLKNPEKSTIIWPNRQQVIQDFIKKMNSYLES
jgi:hypothetical protein